MRELGWVIGAAAIVIVLVVLYQGEGERVGGMHWVEGR